jgi:hypothetical protein
VAIDECKLGLTQRFRYRSEAHALTKKTAGDAEVSREARLVGEIEFHRHTLRKISQVGRKRVLLNPFQGRADA